MVVDHIPVFSQGKSFLQWVSGDSEGARETQDNFLNETPIVGDVTFAVKWLAGDKSAHDTRRRTDEAWSRTADAVPVVGHAKAGLHLATGDWKRAKESFHRANKGTAVTFGTITGGPAGAVAAGVAYDLLESCAELECRGCVRGLQNFYENPRMGTALDMVTTPLSPVIPKVIPNPIKGASVRAGRSAVYSYRSVAMRNK